MFYLQQTSGDSTKAPTEKTAEEICEEFGLVNPPLNFTDEEMLEYNSYRGSQSFATYICLRVAA